MANDWELPADCRVTESIQVPHPSEVPLLAYISGSTSVVLVLIYPGVKDADVRDAVNLTSTKAVHSKVRDGKSTKYPESLSWVIPEGWNTFTLLVADGSLTVTLVQNEDQVTLYTLTLEHTVNKMYAEGSVAHCQRGECEAWSSMLSLVERSRSSEEVKQVNLLLCLASCTV